MILVMQRPGNRHIIPDDFTLKKMHWYLMNEMWQGTFRIRKIWKRKKVTFVLVFSGTIQREARGIIPRS